MLKNIVLKEKMSKIDYDLKMARKADIEIDNLPYECVVNEIIKNIENELQRLAETHSKQYTQECLAKKAGIELSTYKSYIRGDSASITLISYLELENALGINCSKILNILHIQHVADNLTPSRAVKKIMENIEFKRKSLIKSAPEKYTQEYLSEKAGIATSSYKRYICGDSTDITLIAYLNLENTLGWDCSKIFINLHK